MTAKRKHKPAVTQPPGHCLTARDGDKLVADGQVWQRVKAPKPWRPKVSGEVLVGTYGGKQSKEGMFGRYAVVIIVTPDAVHTVSGTVINGLFDGCVMEVGTPVRVLFKGDQPSRSGEGFYRDFDLYVPQECIVKDEDWKAK